MLKSHTPRVRSVSRRLASSALLALLAGCGPQEPPLDAAPQTAAPRAALSRAGSAATRAARIARVQAEAPPDYDIRTVGTVFQAHNRAQGFDVELGPQVDLRFAGEDRLSLSLEGYGCDGELERMSEGRPIATGNRVEYRRQGARTGDELTEWYVHGPLGLEQGFTLERALGCGERDAVIDLELGGTLSPTVAPGAGKVVLRNARGAAVAGYGELYVVDSVGRELPSRLEVVAGSARIRFDVRQAVYPVRVDPLIGIEQAKLVATEPKPNDNLGTSVALWGDTALATGTKGPVYLFERTGGVWTAQPKLLPNNPLYTNEFGVSVAVSDDTILVGALSVYVDDSTTYPGLVDVLVRSNGQWAYDASLQATDGLTGRSFGQSVAISGDTAVVGAHTDINTASGSGSVFVFTRKAGSWTQQAMLVPSDGSFLDIFGGSVAISGDTLVVGARGDDDTGYEAGAAYVFERSGGTWTEQAKLVADSSTGSDYFGNGVAVSGDTIVVGAPQHMNVRGGSGAAYVFVRSNGSWTQQAELTAGDGSSLNGLGISVAIEGNVALVGANYDSTNALYAGAAYLFTRTDETWTEQGRLLASDGSELDRFGESVALSGATVLVGASEIGAPGPGTGSAYVFTLMLTYGEPCDDNDGCYGGFCVDGVCCDSPCDGGPCDACSVALGAPADGTCTALTTCDDGNACTQTDVCEAGQCIGSNDVVCAAPLDECHDVGTCDPESGACGTPERPDNTPCSLGICLSGECAAAEESVPESDVQVVGGCGCQFARRTHGNVWWIAVILLTTGIRLARVAGRRCRGACERAGAFRCRC